MREILFRGLRTDGKEWVYGYLFEIVINNNKREFIIPCDTACPKEITIKDLQVEVIPETVGQYTGLKDGTGKNIFEADLIRTKREQIIEVRYCHVEEFCCNDTFEYFGFSAFNINLQKAFHLDRSIIDGEVIGNIHEK